MSERIGDRVRSAARRDLPVEVGHVTLNRPDTESQGMGDLLV